MAMNISQALRRMNVLKGRVAQWEQRARNANVVGEDEKPTYNYKECVDERKKALSELLLLGARVAESNATTKIALPADGSQVSVAEAIRRLDNIKAEITWVKSLPALAQTEVVTTRQKPEWDAKERTHTYREVEYKQTCTVDERAKERMLDQLQDDFNELNSLVEGSNHNTTLQV